MSLPWLLLLVAALFRHSVASEGNTTSPVVKSTQSTKSTFSPLPDPNKNLSVLHLSYKNITLNENEITGLHKYINTKELYLNNNTIAVLRNYSFDGLSELAILDLSNNFITTVEQAAFAGLNKLTALYLQNNNIAQIDSNVFTLLGSLKILNLQKNRLANFDIKVSLNLISIALSENPWNCSCGLLSLQDWLNNTNVTMENENTTVCASPSSLKKYPIKTVFLPNCPKRRTTEATAIPFQSIDSSNDTVLAAYNGTIRKSLSSGFQPPGKSWTFLMGVLVVIVGTTLLIIMAIKFPVWYRYLISYNHSRLDEDEPEMFEETFTPHMSALPQTPDNYEDESVIVFEQFHSFVPEDDGFIEDKYIES
ncbi:leucine-rich repeat-containing protein 19 [Sceloporus undulatus]|uniref:leucine-rich repeat-containing protein 19 n=1 Tax=Sceloporus undulatus TaxID=8520 RepID=UPI001C4C8D99|nr:leucine-rich repeat-containing protein 19 [Sceloporus undulatus]